MTMAYATGDMIRFTLHEQPPFMFIIPHVNLPYKTSIYERLIFRLLPATIATANTVTHLQ